MPRLLLTTLALVPLLACGDGGGGETGSETSAAVTTTGLTGATTANTATTAPASTTGSLSSTSTSPTTGDDGTTGPGTTTGSTTTGSTTTGDESTTGAAEYCYGWQDGAREPFLELYIDNVVLLADGANMSLQCGGQGSFMFALFPQLGGFVPASQFVDFAITVDVEGFNSNPEGHFYSADPVGYYIGCEALGGGGVPGILPVFPLDNLDDLGVLDGKPASVHVEMHTGQAPVIVDAEVTLRVVEDKNWRFCGG